MNLYNQAWAQSFGKDTEATLQGGDCKVAWIHIRHDYNADIDLLSLSRLFIFWSVFLTAARIDRFTRS